MIWTFLCFLDVNLSPSFGCSHILLVGGTGLVRSCGGVGSMYSIGDVCVRLSAKLGLSLLVRPYGHMREKGIC